MINLSRLTDYQVVAREEEESTSPTPELGGRRISPTRYDLAPHVQESGRKETRFEEESGRESGSSPDSPRGGVIIQSRSSSQGSKFPDQ